MPIFQTYQIGYFILFILQYTKSLFQKISNFNPDIVLALGWSHLIPEKVLNLTKLILAIIHQI